MEVLVFKDIKNNRWTIWSIDKKVHLGYRKSLSLKDCKLIVLEDKRQKVVSTGKRFPHAWIIGKITKVKKQTKEITYNPFKDKGFILKNKIIKESNEIFFSSKGKCFVK